MLNVWVAWILRIQKGIQIPYGHPISDLLRILDFPKLISHLPKAATYRFRVFIVHDLWYI
jgi:hypothetical protein